MDVILITFSVVGIVSISILFMPILCILNFNSLLFVSGSRARG